MQVNFPISIDKFFEYFLSEDAIYSFVDHRKASGDFETSMTKW